MKAVVFAAWYLVSNLPYMSINGSPDTALDKEEPDNTPTVGLVAW